MQQKILKPFWQAIALGVLAGMRSNAAPAVVSHILSHHPSGQLENSPLKLLQSPKAANTLKVLLLGEFAGDKLPVAGDRIKPVSVAFRSLSGSLAGTSICKANGENALAGAVLGAAAAFGSTFCSFYLRKMIVKKTGIYDPIIGAIEDILVVGAAISLVKYSDPEQAGSYSNAGNLIGDKDKCIAAGMDDFISEHFVREEVREVLDRFFALSVSIAQLARAFLKQP